MNFQSKNLGFTLVELMVVIAIIGILATLIMVTLDNTKTTARNTRRLADIKELQLALKLFYNDNGFYPTAITAGSSISRNGVNYLLRVPENPKPWNDGSCLNQDYIYKQIENGKRYTISFCLSDRTDDLSSGTKLATANGILNCPTDWVGIPGSETFQTNDFCVMKYEAKCALASNPTSGLTTPLSSNSTYNNSSQACAGSYMPVSTSSGFPIANITHSTAKTYCQNIGGHLITNAEWMTIARNVEQVGANWWGQSYHSGSLDLGNYGLSSSGLAMDGSLQFGSNRWWIPIYNRDLLLLSGDTIKDFSGNVAEWVDGQCTLGSGSGNYHNTSGALIDWPNSNLDDYERGVAGPSDPLWISNSEGVGQYKGCSTNGNAFLRGGHLNAGYDVGIYHLDLTNNTSSSSGSLIGFRCVK